MSDDKPEPIHWNSDMIMTPVCMAETDNLISEIKKRYGTGAFILLEPTPATEQELQDIIQAAKETGYITFPFHYHEITNVWGKPHNVLSILSRLTHETNEDIKSCQRNVDESEKF